MLFGGIMYEIITMPNGVRLVFERMSGVRSASVGIWVGVGSRLERHGEEGSAHFIEHMLFKGTVKSSAAKLAGRMDAIGGQINAFTSRENTCFYARVLDSHLHEAVGILTEMFFDSLFDESEVLNEREVILDEIDMYRDTPEDLVVEQLLGKCLSGSLGKPVLGNAASLKKITGSSLRVFKDNEYTPDRVLVSLCGNFDDTVLDHLQSRFSAMMPRTIHRSGRKSAYKPACVFRRRSTEQNHFCLMWPGLSADSEDRFSWQVMSMILGGGMSSRLFQKVREENGLCYSIGSFTSSFSDAGLFGISTAVSRDTEEKALALICSEINRFREDGIGKEELDRARELIKSSVILSLESTSSRMNRLGSSVLALGRCLTADEIIDRFNSVTADSVYEITRKTFTDSDISISAVGRLSSDTDRYRTLLGSLYK